ncbi:MAG: SGNH/GDSL hydrolase family protein [Verrucomicrobiota bacterium]
MRNLVTATILLLAMHAAAFATDLDAAIFQAGNRILFQGDSITDGARGRNNDPNHILGHSYAFLVAAKYGATYPERRLEFFNRGISGNKVPDLLNRWQTNTIDLKPTVVSILIGVNDIWHPLNAGQEVSVAKYEEGYDKLIAQTIAALPNAKIILLEPFITSGSATSPKWDLWQSHLKDFQAVVAKLGVKYKAPVVKLQRVFDDACKHTPAEYWVWDGVHPTYAGNQLIADEWVRVAAATWPAAK